MDGFFCVVKDQELNSYYPFSEFRDLNGYGIAKKLKHDPSLISYYSPLYRERIKPESFPLIDYPDLFISKKSEKHPIYPYHIHLISKSNLFDFAASMTIMTNYEVVFPTLFVLMTVDDINTMVGSDFLELCKKSLIYESMNQKIFIDDEELDPLKKISEYLASLKKGMNRFICELGQKAIKDINGRIFLCKQIVSSEESYLNDLKMLLDYWAPAFKATAVFCDFEVKSLFKDIKAIINNHNEYYSSLIKQEISFSQSIAPLFMFFIPFFRASSSFISNYKANDQFINERLKNKFILSKFKEVESRLPDGSLRSFFQFYVTPVQRYPKYTLLFRDLDKKTPLFHPDKEYIGVIIKELGSLNGSIDSQSAKLNRFFEMSAIQQSIGSSFSIIDSRRYYVMDTECKMLKENNKQVSIHLFNDMVMISKKERESIIPLYVFLIVETILYDVGDTTALFFSNKSECTIIFNEASEKQIWVEKFYEMRDHCINDSIYRSSCIVISYNEKCEKYRPLYESKGVHIEDYIYLIGGFYEDDSMCDSFITYKLSSMEFFYHPCPVSPRAGHSVISIGKYIYVCFGFNGNLQLNDIWQFNIDEFKWTKMSPNVIPIGRSYHSCVEYNGKLVFVGGSTISGMYQSVDIYDPENNFYSVFSDFSLFPSHREKHSAVMMNDHDMIMIGGVNGQMYCADCATLNLITMEWTIFVFNGISIIGSGFSLLCVNNRLLVYCGYSIVVQKPFYIVDLATMISRPAKLAGLSINSMTSVTSVYENHKIIQIFGGLSTNKFPYPTMLRIFLDSLFEDNYEFDSQPISKKSDRVIHEQPRHSNSCNEIRRFEDNKAETKSIPCLLSTTSQKYIQSDGSAISIHKVNDSHINHDETSNDSSKSNSNSNESLQEELDNGQPKDKNCTFLESINVPPALHEKEKNDYIELQPSTNDNTAFVTKQIIREIPLINDSTSDISPDTDKYNAVDIDNKLYSVDISQKLSLLTGSYHQDCLNSNMCISSIDSMNKQSSSSQTDDASSLNEISHQSVTTNAIKNEGILISATIGDSNDPVTKIDEYEIKSINIVTKTKTNNLCLNEKDLSNKMKQSEEKKDKYNGNFIQDISSKSFSLAKINESKASGTEVFNYSAFIKNLNIDDSHLPPGSQMATKMKCKKLWTIMNKNSQTENSICSANDSRWLFLKINDQIMNKISIIKMKETNDVDDINNFIKAHYPGRSFRLTTESNSLEFGKLSKRPCISITIN